MHFQRTFKESKTQKKHAYQHVFFMLFGALFFIACSNTGKVNQCDAEHLIQCKTTETCTEAGGKWEEDRCSRDLTKLCALEQVENCTSEETCTEFLGHWYEEACHAKPACKTETLDLCTTQESCEAIEKFWYDDICHAEPMVDTCTSSTLEHCKNSAECLEVNAYWYLNECHSEAYACETRTVAKESRVFGINALLLKAMPKPPVFELSDLITLTESYGSEVTSLHLNWKTMEETEGVYTGSEQLEELATVLAEKKTKLNLVIPTFDLAGSHIPAYLDAEGIDSEGFKTSLIKYIDFLFTVIDKKKVYSIQLGREVDHYANMNTDFLVKYHKLLLSVKEHVDAQYLGVKLGTNINFYALNVFSESPLDYSKLGENLDYLGINYYPIQRFSEEKSYGLNDLVTHFNKIATSVSSKVIIQEAGFPEFQPLDLTDVDQAVFICELFHAWDAQKESIEAILLTRFMDVSLESGAFIGTHYHYENDNIGLYFQKLGILTETQIEKKSGALLKESLSQREWF